MDLVGEAISRFIDGALSVDFYEMAIQVLATLLLFLVIRFFFWNNITDFLDKRKEMMASEFGEAELANKEAQSLKIEASTELNEVRMNAKGIVDEAKDRGERERSSIIDKAKGEAKIVIENAHKEIDSEIDKARASINDEIVNVAILMAEKVIDKEIDRSKHKELIKEITDEVVN